MKGIIQQLQSVTLVDNTQRALESDYIRAVAHYIEHARTDDILSIYQVGEVGVAGLSDIDLMVVFKDAKRSITRRYGIHHLTAFDQYLFSHDPWFLDKQTFSALPYWFSYFDIKHVFGAHLILDDSEKDNRTLLSILLASHLLFKVPSDFLKFSGLIGSSLNVRIMIAMINSLRHSLNLWHSIIESQQDIFKQFDSDFTCFRKQWFQIDSTTRGEQLRLFTAQAINYGLILQNELSDYIMKNWIENPPISNRDWVFNFNSQLQFTFTDNWSANSSIETALKSNIHSLVFPKGLGILLCGLGIQPTPLGVSIVQRLNITDYTPILRKEVQFLLQRHGNAIVGYQTFQSTKFGRSISSYNSYGMPHTRAKIKRLVCKGQNAFLRYSDHTTRFLQQLLSRKYYNKTSPKSITIKLAWLRKLILSILTGTKIDSSNLKGTTSEITIFKVDHIGDFILATGAIRLLLKSFEDFPFILIVSKEVSSLAKQQFPSATIIEVPTKAPPIYILLPFWLKFSRILKRHPSKNLVCLRHQRTTYHNLLLSWCQRSTSYGVKTPDWVAHNTPEVMVEYTADITVDYPYTTEQCSLPSDIEAHRRVLSQILNREIEDEEMLPSLSNVPFLSEYEDVVIISPLGSSPIRCYTGDPLVSLLLLLQQKGINRSILIGNPAQSRELLNILALAKSRSCNNVEVLEPCSLNRFISVVNSAKGTISVETATAHISIALNRPTVGIIGGGHYGFFAPWGRGAHHRWINHQMPCYHCNWQCIHPEPYCITQITPEAITDAFLAIMTTNLKK